MVDEAKDGWEATADGAVTPPPRALIACVPNELHELGPRTLAGLLEDDGWEVDFCGSRTPFDEVLATIRERRPRFVGLSVAVPRHLDGAERMIAGIRDAFGPDTPPVVVGGAAFREPRRWRQVDADLYIEDPTTVVQTLRRFKG